MESAHSFEEFPPEIQNRALSYLGLRSAGGGQEASATGSEGSEMSEGSEGKEGSEGTERKESKEGTENSENTERTEIRDFSMIPPVGGHSLGA